MSDLSDRRKIHARHRMESAPHILDGYTVAQFVRTARAGWPKVPVPADPIKAQRKVVEAWGGVVTQHEGELS